jgi:hypothetical protein
MTINQTAVQFEGKFESLNFKLDHPELSFVAYEFEGAEFVIEESGCEQSLFRVQVEKETGYTDVYAAYSQDFDVMEDVTHYFDIEQLQKDIEAWEATHEVSNQGEYYVRYCALRDKDWDCDEAIVKCYDDEDTDWCTEYVEQYLLIKIGKNETRQVTFSEAKNFFLDDKWGDVECDTLEEYDRLRKAIVSAENAEEFNLAVRDTFGYILA